MTFCWKGMLTLINHWKGQGSSALYGPHMIAIETKMSPLPQSVPIQVGPGTHSIPMPTCEVGGGVEWRITPFSSLFKLVYLPKYHCRLTRRSEFSRWRNLSMESKVPSHISGKFCSCDREGRCWRNTCVCLEGGEEEERIECVFRRALRNSSISVFTSC